MKILRALGFVFICLAVGVGVYFLMPREVTVEAPLPALTYETPVKVHTKVVRAGDPFTTESTRCNNTDEPIAIESSIYWQSADGKKLIPYTTRDGLQVGRIQGVAEPGCRSNHVVTGVFPEGIAEGEWRLVGAVCYGVITLGAKEECTSWQTEPFRVLEGPQVLH